MIREISIRIQELASFCAGSKRLQHSGIKPTCTVPGIHCNMQALKRLILCAVQAASDPVAELLHVNRQKRRCPDGAGLRMRRQVSLSSSQKQLGNLGRFESAFVGKEFETVFVPGMMAGSNHNSTVSFKSVCNCAHIHGWCGAHTEIIYICTCTADTVCCCVQQGFTGYPAVPSQSDTDRR